MTVGVVWFLFYGIRMYRFYSDPDKYQRRITDKQPQPHNTPQERETEENSNDPRFVQRLELRKAGPTASTVWPTEFCEVSTRKSSRLFKQYGSEI